MSQRRPDYDAMRKWESASKEVRHIIGGNWPISEPVKEQESEEDE